MANFAHLKKLEVQGTQEYPLIELEGEPVLIVKPAGESNKEYFNALLRKNGSAGKRQKKLKVDGALTAKLREDDRELYPKFVIVGWSGVLDAKGKEVKYTEEECGEFLAALPNWIFDRIREFASDPESFVDMIDSEGKAGN